MSFVGLVTRKEKDTGVTLLAKIVTPNKKKSAKKAFKVKVKANALDDYSCCVIDHATVKTRLENSQELGAMIEDIVLSYNGVNGTTISYEMNDKPNHYPKLTDYITEDGKLLGRPKYNPSSSGNAEGTLSIIVRKGNAEVRSNLQIAVKAITADEVFAQGSFTKQKIWEAIRGMNAIQYSDAMHEGGNHNITYPLTLVNEVRCDDVSTVPVKLSYTITDDLIAYLPSNGEYNGKSEYNDENGELIKSRIDPATGKVAAFSYSASAYLANTLNMEGSMITNDGMVSARRVRIGGLRINVNMSLDEATTPRTMILDAAVMSKLLTNQEVFDNIISKNFRYFVNDVSKEFSDSDVVSISKIGTAATYQLKFMHQNICTQFESNDLGIAKNEIKSGIEFKYTLRDSTGSEYSPTDAAIAFDNYGDFTNAASTDATMFYKPLVINFTGMGSLTVDKRAFTIQCDITVGGFSPNGDNFLGSPLQTTKIAKFSVNIPTSAA